MRFLTHDTDPDDSGKEFPDKSLDQRYREAAQLDLFGPEDIPMMKRVLAFLKELGRSKKRS